MSKQWFVILLVSAFLFISSAIPAATDVSPDSRIERGRYLVIIAGCNDCHTSGYAMQDGNVPESEWLKGDQLGWKGPWGTTYPSNLRLTLSEMSEDQWVVFARNLRARLPMPSFNLNKMHEEDLRAIYAYIRQLQPVGEPSPVYLPPDLQPAGAFVSFPAPPPE